MDKNIIMKVITEIQDNITQKKDSHNLANKKWRQKNPNYFKEYYQTHKERRKRESREYSKKHRNEHNEYKKLRYKLNKEIRIKHNLRVLLNRALKKYSTTGKIQSSSKYGINYKTIIEHLKPFPKNLEDYEIDHIKPLCLFNLNNPEEVKQAFKPENHQWLLAKDNSSKGAKF